MSSSGPIDPDALAHPVPELGGKELGITVEQYFAAHAPDVPFWFPMPRVGGRDTAAIRAEQFVIWRWWYARAMCHHPKTFPLPNFDE